MSDRIFEAIDVASGAGIGPSLKVIEVAAATDGNYSLSRKARYLLRQMELGLFERSELIETEQKPQEEEPEKKKSTREEALEQLEASSKQFHSESGDRYKADGKLKEAADELRRAGRHREAINLWIEEGSVDSLRSASSTALDKEVRDYKLGFDLTLKVWGANQAFKEAGDLLYHKLSQEERQGWEEYVLKAVYSSIIDSVKAQVEEKTGKRPGGNTLPQLLETVGDKEILGKAYYDLDGRPFIEIIIAAKKSSNPEILQMGIDFINFKRGSAPYDYQKDSNGGDLLYLRAKLTGSDEDIQAILKTAEEKLEKEGKVGWNTQADDVIKILSHYKKHAEALEVAERFLSPTDNERFRLLKELGDRQKLASAYREIGDHINYVMVVFGKPEQSRYL